MLFKICELETKNFEDFVSKKSASTQCKQRLTTPGEKNK